MTPVFCEFVCCRGTSLTKPCLSHFSSTQRSLCMAVFFVFNRICHEPAQCVKSDVNITEVTEQCCCRQVRVVRDQFEMVVARWDDLCVRQRFFRSVPVQRVRCQDTTPWWSAMLLPPGSDCVCWSKIRKFTPCSSTGTQCT